MVHCACVLVWAMRPARHIYIATVKIWGVKFYSQNTDEEKQGANYVYLALHTDDTSLPGKFNPWIITLNHCNCASVNIFDHENFPFYVTVHNIYVSVNKWRPSVKKKKKIKRMLYSQLFLAQIHNMQIVHPFYIGEMEWHWTGSRATRTFSLIPRLALFVFTIIHGWRKTEKAWERSSREWHQVDARWM